jgi:cholesterol transport system auxiliary component
MTQSGSDLSRRQFAAGLLASSPALSGCGIGGSPPRKMALFPVSDFPPGLRSVSWSLIVDEPGAGRQLDTAQIAVMTGTHRIEYYADAEWADAAPAMIRELLVRSFQNTNRLPIVTSTRLGLPADLMLVSNLPRFDVETEPAGTQQAVVVLEVALLRLPRRNVIAGTRFQKATRIPTSTAESVAAAFNESLSDVMRRTVVWTLEIGKVEPKNG